MNFFKRFILSFFAPKPKKNFIRLVTDGRAVSVASVEEAWNARKNAIKVLYLSIEKNEASEIQSNKT